MNYNIALLKGDGIGPEIVDSAVRVLEAIGKKYNHTFNFTPFKEINSLVSITSPQIGQYSYPGTEISCKQFVNASSAFLKFSYPLFLVSVCTAKNSPLALIL